MMRHLAAYLLLKSGGNDSPTAGDVKTALAAVGVEVDGAKLDAFIASVDGKSIAELIESAQDRIFVGGGGGGGGGGAAAGGDAPAAAAAPEKPKEEEVDPMEGGMSMFGAEASDY